MKKTLVVSIGMFSLLAACLDSGDDELGGDLGANSSTPPGSGTGIATVCREGQKEYTGLGDVKLVSGRLDGMADVNGTMRTMDRHRVKPNAAFAADLHRILGTTGQTSMDALLADAKEVFTDGEGRSFEEPEVSAVGLSTAYRAAFRGCKVYSTSVSAWSAEPNVTNAAEQCAAFQQKAWDLMPTKSEIDACIKVATDSSNFTTAKVTAPSDKWAYMCASVLTSNHFLAY
jgi:hypothetical protein